MNFQEYQEQSRKTAIYPKAGDNFVYPVLGIAGESGEVAEKIKKVLREKNGIVDEETKQEIEKELGDLLWYMSQLASELSISFDGIAQKNIIKTQSRMERGTLLGNGDNR
ncbi:MAG: nucleoside triphosphate pyrophosphohydrolase family protein [Candidatus Moranbacteria bacterium]|nr:nucleoside triphosphate pyrophosphohydrolase family protein [Candidatus Moranbacteria bacterium]